MSQSFNLKLCIICMDKMESILFLLPALQLGLDQCYLNKGIKFATSH